MAKVYTEEEQLEFIEVAQEMGTGPAMRSLGYPGSHHTATKWFTSRNIELPTVDTLAQKAQALGAFYSDKEKVIAAQAVLDRCVEALESDSSLRADDINKLANALHRAIQTIQLIEGKATAITESKGNTDSFEASVQDMINAAKAKNALREDELKDQVTGE